MQADGVEDVPPTDAQKAGDSRVCSGGLKDVDKYTSRTRRRRPVYLLISVAVAGIAAVALLAQQLSAERPMGELPFVPEEFAAETPICSAR